MHQLRTNTVHATRPRAFTLVEAVVSMVIVGIMFVAAIGTIGAAAQSRRIQAEIREGDGLARALMCEIQQCRYGTTGGTVIPVHALGAGGARSAWDTIDDYHGYSESPPAARDGADLAGYTGWTREVHVERVDPIDADGDSTRSTDKGLKRITITTRGPSGKVTTLVSVRSRWSLADSEPSLGMMRAHAATLHLRITGGADIFAGGVLPNGQTAAVPEEAVVDGGEEPKEPEGAASGGLVGVVGGLLGGLLGGGN